jgi:hypothetical protein
MSDFIKWMKKSFLCGPNDKIRLCAHNGHSLDAPLLFNSLKLNKFGKKFKKISNRVIFADTLKAFRSSFPEHKSFAFKSLISQSNIKGTDANHSDALDIANDLKLLVEVKVRDVESFLAQSEKKYP